MKRRYVLAGGAAFLADAAFANDGFFHWRKPGGDPYRGNLNTALVGFRDLMPADVQEEFRRKVAARQLVPDARVHENWQVTRMMFGVNQKVPNVIVNPSDLAAWGDAPRSLEMYTVERVSGSEAKFYALFRPTVCNNWAIKLGRRVCIRDELLCDQGCQQLKAKQYQS